MKYSDVTVKSVADLIAALKSQNHAGGLVWFRGHARSTWTLVPSLARKATDLKAEAALLKRFMQNAVPHLDRPLVAAQLGVFTVNHQDHKPIEAIGATKHVWRWIVPASAKMRLRTELRLLGFTALTLFPDLDRVADLAKELLQ